MARDKLITIRIEGDKRQAFGDLAKSQNTDTASLLYDFINQCLSGEIDISLVTGKGKELGNRIDTNRLDKLEATTQRIDNWIGALSERLNDWILRSDRRVNDCEKELSNKITSLEHRLNALSMQLDSQKDSHPDSQLDSHKDSHQIDTDRQQETPDMEPFLKREREASIASPFPPSLPPDEPAIKTLPIDEPVMGAIEDPEKKIMEPVGGSDSLDTLPVPPITDKTIDQNAIEDLTDQSSKRKGLTDSELARHLRIDKSNITRWKQKGEPTQKYKDKWEFRGRLWYEKD